MLSVDLFLWNNELTGGAVICIWNWVRKNADCTNNCSLLINTKYTLNLSTDNTVLPFREIRRISNDLLSLDNFTF